MRDKARHGTEMVQRTLRKRSLRIGIGLAVLFAFGLMASGALGDTFSVVGTTGTDTPASSDASTTDTTSAPSSAPPATTDPSSSSTDTTATTDAASSSSTGTAAPVPYIVT